MNAIKNILLFFLILFSSSQAAKSVPKPIKILIYNLHISDNLRTFAAL